MDSATSIGLGMLAVALLAATVAFWRWEVAHEPVPGVLLPERSRLLESDAEEAVGADPCQLVAELRGAAEPAIGRWWERLQLRGWERVATDAERTVLRRRGQRMLVNVIPLSGEEPWTRLRITVRPCRLSAPAS